MCSLHSFHAFSHTETKLIHPAPIVDFQINHFCYGDTTYFVNTTQGGVFYTWSIFEVDSNDVVTDTIYTSALDNISFLFPGPGKYKIELIADNGHIVSVVKEIKIVPGTKADFDYRSCGSQFNNLSECYDSAFWDFGDGSTSTQDNPQHWFQASGVYRVKLTVKKGSITDTVSKIVYGQASGIDARFTITIFKDSLLYYMNDTGAYVPSDSILVMFNAIDSTIGSMATYHWSFGDEQVADMFGVSGRQVYHRYKKSDTIYPVFLLIRLLCFNGFSSQDLMFFEHGSVASGPVNGLSVFPNPTKDVLFISTDKSLTGDVAIFDVLGQKLNSKLIEENNGYITDLDDYPNGMYFVCVEYNGKLVTTKIIKE